MRSLIISLAVAGALSVGSAAAADLIVEAPVAEAATSSNLYVKLYGGGTFPNTLAWDGEDYDLEAGWFIGAAIGTEFAPGFSVELDASASSANYVDDDGQSSAALFANLVYTAPVSDELSLYLGAGVGLIGVEYDGDSNSGFGGQVFAGLGYEVAENVTLFGELRYQSTFDTVDLDGWDVEHNRAAALVGVKFGF